MHISPGASILAAASIWLKCSEKYFAEIIYSVNIFYSIIAVIIICDSVAGSSAENNLFDIMAHKINLKLSV